MIKNVKLTNLRKHSTINLSYGDTSDYVIDTIDWGSVKVDFGTYRIGDKKGVKLQSEVSNKRTVMINGYVISRDIIRENTWEKWLEKKEEKIKQNKKKLNDIFCPFDDIEISVIEKGKEFKIVGRLEESIRYSNEEYENNEVMCRFQIYIDCFNPFFVSQESSFEYVGTQFSINNDGDTEEDFKIEILIDADVTKKTDNNITITNLTTNDTIALRDVSYDKNYIIRYDMTDDNFILETQSEKGVKTNLLNNIFDSNTSFKFVKGTNLIRISGFGSSISDATKLKNTIIFTKHYASIEGM